MVRILFDRCIFHGSKFDRLKASGVQSAVKAGRYKVYLTPMFVEETLTHAFNNVAEFKEHWEFINSLAGVKWFKNAEETVTIELGDSIRGESYYLRPKQSIRQANNAIQNTLETRLSPDQIAEPRAAINRAIESRQLFRKSRLELRRDIKVDQYELEPYFCLMADWFIENGIMPHHNNSDNYLTVWRTKRRRCIFTEAFIRAWLTTILLPLRDHRLRVDENDKPDAEQLAFLVWADIMVSDDTRFMKRAFELLYGHTKKGFLTLEKFLATM